MNLQFLNWKLYLKNPADADPMEYFQVFNDWIPDSPEIFVDVADYRHVHDGPVIVLVGHYLNLSLDATGRRLGLLYDYKHPMEGGNEEKLRSTLLGLVRAALRLEQEARFSKKPRFRAGELRLAINSRALAPNSAEALAAVKPELEKVLRDAFGGAVELVQDPDPRQRFSVQVTAPGAQGLDQLLKRLG